MNLPDEVKLRIMSFSRLDDSLSLTSALGVSYTSLIEEILDYDPTFNPKSLLYALRQRRLSYDRLIGTDAGLLYQGARVGPLSIDYTPSLDQYTVGGSDYVKELLPSSVSRVRRIGRLIEFRHPNPFLVQEIDVLSKTSRSPRQSLLTPSTDLLFRPIRVAGGTTTGDWDEVCQLWSVPFDVSVTSELPRSVEELLAELLSIVRSRAKVVRQLRTGVLATLYPYMGQIEALSQRGNTLVWGVNHLFPSAPRKNGGIVLPGVLAPQLSRLYLAHLPLDLALLNDCYSVQEELDLVPSQTMIH